MGDSPVLLRRLWVARQFRQLYPQIQLNLKRLQTPEQVETLNNRQIDLGLLHPPIDDDTLILETIYREQLVVALPDNHLLANVSQSVSLQQLANESFILFPRHVGSVLYDKPTDRALAQIVSARFDGQLFGKKILMRRLLGVNLHTQNVSMSRCGLTVRRPKT